MSYLGWPRLHFAGQVQTDVATVNNIAPYYDNNLFEPRFQRLWVRGVDANGLWNPRGSGAFRLRDCKVTSVCFADGGTRPDPLVGGRVADDNLRVNAKMVDLDPDNQLSTEIHGLTVRLVDARGAEQCRGDFVPTPFDDFWVRGQWSTGQPDPASSYQSVLTNLRWAPALSSPFLLALRESTEDGLLSIKFNLDGVSVDTDKPDKVTFGRIVGSIGTYRAGEPKRFVAARRLRGAAGGKLNQAPCQVDAHSGVVFVDLGNSIGTTSPGGPLQPIGPLSLGVLDPAGRPTVLAALEGMDGDFYSQRAGILTARLTPEQLETVETNRLAVLESGQVLIAENADASFARADGPVFRLSPEETGSATIHVTSFGKPMAGAELFVGSAPAPPWLAHPSRVITDESGRALVGFTGHDPGNPRRHIDGQLLGAPYGFAARPAEPEGRFSVHVYDAYQAPTSPTWINDVQPIFQQYANLYPVMRDILDLSSYHDVVKYRSSIRASLLLPPDSPNHMPATRDLSPAKRDMIVRWLDSGPQPPVLAINTPQDLRNVLQQALLVELATIPAYLCTLFSLRPDTNQEIAEIIRGVVLEEMLHMALVANLLNAVGGAPRIGRPGFVPTYPGRLPGSVLPGLLVRLRKCSIEHIRDVFMEIEQPEYPVVGGARFTGAVIDTSEPDLDTLRTLENWFVSAEYNPLTIGWFYNQIARAICRLDAEGELFTGDPARQVSWPDAPGTLYRITDKHTALLAIYEIIEQGEGSPQDPAGERITDAAKFGHYYRFKEIVEGRRLVRNAGGKWVYEGAEVPFDPDGVFPMADDPDSYSLPANSVARRESLLCDEFYTNMLSSLHRVFNGRPDDLRDAVGLMYATEVQARKLLTLPSPLDPESVVGPSFQSPGVRFG